MKFCVFAWIDFVLSRYVPHSWWSLPFVLSPTTLKIVHLKTTVLLIMQARLWCNTITPPKLGKVVTLQRKTQEFRGTFLIFVFCFRRILQFTPDFYDFMFFTRKWFAITNPFPIPFPPLHELDEGHCSINKRNCRTSLLRQVTAA